MMEHTTTGLPVDTRTGAERAYAIVRERGYVAEDELLRLALVDGNGFDRQGIHRDLQREFLAAGSLVMVWTGYGQPYYVTPLHALRIVDRLTWTDDGHGETIPVVQAPADLEL